MEETGAQPKRISGGQLQGCSVSPPKTGLLVKRKLSLRSKNSSITATAQTPSSFSWQLNALAQKQSGKENELPFDHEIGDKKLVTITRSLTKKKKSLIPGGVNTDSERRISKRRFSGDYKDQLSSNKVYRKEIEPVNRPAKILDLFQGANDIKSRDVKPKFSIYDEEKNEEFEAGVKEPVSRFGIRVAKGREGCDTDTIRDFDQAKESDGLQLRRAITEGDFRSKKIEKGVKNFGNELANDGMAQETEDSTTENVRPVIGNDFSDQSSDAEFRIERVDRRDGMTPRMNNLRKVKSGSCIGHLKITLRKGEDISPLKRRIIQLKKSVINLGWSAGIKTALKNSEIELKKADDVVKKISDKGSHNTVDSIQLKPSEKTTEKINPETTKRIEGIKVDGDDRRKLSSYEINSQNSLVKLYFPPTISDNGSAASETEIEETEAREREKNLRKKWDAVVEEFKKRREKNFRVEKPPINGVASNDFTKLDPGLISNSHSQPSLSLHSKLPARPKTKTIRSAARVDKQKTRIEIQPDGTIDDFELIDQQNQSVEDCDRIAGFKKYLTSRKVEKRDFLMDYERDTVNSEYAREGRNYNISRNFLEGKSVSPEQRRIVINFLIGVHAYLSTSSNTLYQSTKIFDTILDMKDVSMKELQLVALGASWIAIKNIETNIPTASEMISYAKDMYKSGGKKLLCKCEEKILKTLNFNIRFSDPFYISAYYIKQGLAPKILSEEQSIRKIHHCADYIMNAALLDERYSGASARLLAAAASQTAVHLVLGASDDRAKWFRWQTEKISSYAQEDIERFVTPLLFGVLESAEKGSSTNAVYKKYKSNRYENISDYLITRIKKLTQNKD